MAKETEKTPAPAKQVALAPKFPLSTLQEHCKALFGCSTSVFIGATHTLTGEFSKAEIADAITKWKGKEAK
ncbi:MAG: hypothetical protein LBJ12_00985 [Oscillospiraceae bacterium]|jgi:hypothetical protein|nr:hypothetical protein [Oscillospiraceae bacterium]